MRRTDAKDSNKRYFRADDRIVHLNNSWYFSAREGEVGPFPSRSVAEQEVQRFLHERQQLRGFQRSRRVHSKTAAKPAPKPVRKAPAKRAQAAGATGYHLDQKVPSDGLMLTLDDDLLI